MNTTPDADLDRPMSPEEHQSALFANLVLQHTNMAMMLMGKVPHPEAGKEVKDLESARFFVDQVEMLQAKTKGNLTPQEEKFLQQTLMNLRMAFVEAVEEAGKPKPAEPSPSPAPSAPAAAPAQAAAPSPAAESPAVEPSPKKFTKKY